MLAAGRAAEIGSRVSLLERNERLGRKLSITGNGRCNLTNAGDTADFVRSFGRNGKFLYRALTEFSSRDLVAFFEELEVKTKEEEDGRMFPASGSSESVVKALERYMRRRGVTVRLNCRVERILVDEAAGAVSGVRITGCQEVLRADSVILATGGLSYPGTGSTGDGYSMAVELGHSIIPLRPALVPLETEEEFAKGLQGLSLDSIEVAALANGRRFASESGDMLFTHFGVSGPAVLALSALVVEHLDKGEKVELSIHLISGLDAAGIERRLMDEISGSGGKLLRTVMRRLMPNALVPVLMGTCGIPEDRKCSQITGGERKKLGTQLADFRLTVKRSRPIDEAIITRGGIRVGEIDPRTMESKKTRGLYFCGEIIDIDARSGGYNLQAAFSTAHLAGTNA